MRFIVLLFTLAALAVAPAFAQSTLGLEPGDHRLQNDDLGVILWGPDTAPTLSIGKSDIWDRRLPKEQPVITMEEITKRAMAGDKSILNGAAYYTAYSHYDFPCPKPAGQLIVQLPFVEKGGTLHVEKANGASTLTAEHGAKKLRLRIFVSATRNVIVMDGEAAGLAPGDVAFRLWRHQDTIVPGGELHPTLGSEKNSPMDFEPLPAPRAGGEDNVAWVTQDFPGELTFPEGFQSVLALRVEGAASTVAIQENTAGLGTPMIAEKEGRLDHGTFKRFSPINQSPGAAATLTPAQLNGAFTAYATVTTAHSRTRDLAGVCRNADILVAAVGRPEMVKADWVKSGATVIDVGINRITTAEGKTRLVGDVAFDEAAKVAGVITPVPGGVGPMTIAMLMANTVIAAYRKAGRKPPKF